MLTVLNVLLMSKCYCDRASWWFVLVEACCDGVVYIVYGCACRVAAFEAILCEDVWDVVCDVWE